MSTNTTLTPAAIELRTLAQDIIEWADANDLTQAALLKQHGALGDKDILKSALAGKCDDVDKWLTNYRAVANVIAPGDEGEADPLYETLSTTKAVRGQFTRLKMSRTLAKLVIVEGDTGMGKTSAGRIITKKMLDLNPVASIHTIEASAAWGDRPNAMISTMLKALGMPDTSRSQAARMDKLIDAANERPVVFIFDEVHDVGVRCLRTLKTLLSLTTMKVVLLTHPRLFRDLERENWDDVGQLTGNRLVARVNLGKIQEADVEIILLNRLPDLDGDTKTAAQALARAASGNGNFAFVREVLVRVQRQQAKARGQTITAIDIDKHIKAELQARRASQHSL